MSQEMVVNAFSLPGSDAHFTVDTQRYIKNLTDYFGACKDEQVSRMTYLKDKPPSRLAAVLVLLFEKHGHLRVLLTTRAKGLRTHGGETSLPGGKMEDGDEDIIATAFREAAEEVSLPIDPRHIQTLGTLPLLPFHSLIVTPVVALLTDSTLIDKLKPGEGEVDHIFSYPLEAILDPSLAPGLDTLVEHGGTYWPYEARYHHSIDYPVKALGGVTYRVHCYQTSASPITGMTSDVLIKTAAIAYGRAPSFERYASDQLRTFEEMEEAYERNLKDSGRTK